MAQKIITLEGDDLIKLALMIENARAAGKYGLRKLSIMDNGDSIKVKVNERTWSTELGFIDPNSDYAYAHTYRPHDPTGIPETKLNEMRGEVRDSMHLGM